MGPFKVEFQFGVCVMGGWKQQCVTSRLMAVCVSKRVGRHVAGIVKLKRKKALKAEILDGN